MGILICYVSHILKLYFWNPLSFLLRSLASIRWSVRLSHNLWPVTSSLLKAAEEVHLPKTLRSEFGGGLKEFVQQEVSYFEGTENEREFFTTQERQWLVLHLLQTLRAGPEDHVGVLKLIEGQAIGL